MEKSELRPLVLEVLRKDPQTHTNAIEHQVRGLAEGYGRHDALRLQEVLWELLVQGVLAPGKNSSNLHLPFVHITEYGARLLEEDALLLPDPDGYLQAFQERMHGETGPALLCYVREGLESFLVGRYLAVIVSLGIASEWVLDRLVDALAKSLPTARDRAGLRRAVGQAGRSGERRLDAARPYLQALPLSPSLREVVHADVPQLAAFLRQGRDEEGFPIECTIDREAAHAALLAFPGTCERILTLISDLKAARG